MLTLDNVNGANSSDRINDTAVLFLQGGTMFGVPTTFNYLGNSAGSTETFAATTLIAGGNYSFRSTSNGGNVAVTPTTIAYVPLPLMRLR